MIDARVEKLADILVNHSTKVRTGELVTIMGTPASQPLLLACFRKVLEAGGNPRVSITPEEIQRLFLEHASDAQLDFMDPVRMYEADNVAAAIRIRGTENTRALTTTDPRKLGQFMTANRPIQNQLIEHVRWVLCDFPTQALAQEADMSLDEYEDFLYGATNIDWSETEVFLEKLRIVLAKGKEVRIVGANTDLTLRTEGRIWKPAAGEHNMPDGEIFTAPIEDQVNGHIAYEFPAIHYGREVDSIKLEFTDGRIVKASADKGADYLARILDTDAGSRRLGEIGIGVNYGIQRHTKNILFDEKMGGTIHLAVGRAYAFTGGKNESAIHWDMIKDLRSEGAMYLDGARIQENGQFHLA